MNHLIAEAYTLDLDERGHVISPGGIMLGTMASCAQAVMEGAVKVYVSDEPILQWIAYSYLGEPDLYVSAPVRKNPLSWAFPKGSPLRPVLDAAIMKMLVNATWIAQYNELTTKYFPTGMGATEADPSKELIVGPFVAAIVLTATWLLGLAGEEGWRAVKARGGAAGSGGGKPADAGDAEAGAGANTAVPLEQQLAEALALEAHAAAAAAQAAADRATALLAALGARASAASKAEDAAAHPS